MALDKPRKVSVSVTIPPDVLEVLRYMAGQEQRSISYLVGEALRQYVSTHYQAEPVVPQPAALYTTGTTL